MLMIIVQSRSKQWRHRLVYNPLVGQKWRQFVRIEHLKGCHKVWKVCCNSWKFMLIAIYTECCQIVFKYHGLQQETAMVQTSYAKKQQSRIILVSAQDYYKFNSKNALLCVIVSGEKCPAASSRPLRRSLPLIT